MVLQTNSEGDKSVTGGFSQLSLMEPGPQVRWAEAVVPPPMLQPERFCFDLCIKLLRNILLLKEFEDNRLGYNI